MPNMKHPHNTQIARAVAEQVLWIRKDIETTAMHVIKLVYLCHGWMLGICDRPLIVEDAEAWRYGPVVPTVYHAYKSFGGEAIETVSTDRSEEFDKEQIGLIEAVLDAYKNHTAWALSAITHQPGTPWHQVYRDGWGEGTIIPNKVIRRHYKARIETNR